QSLHFSFAHRWTKVPQADYDTLYNWQEYRKAVGHTYTSIHDEPWMAVNRICAPLFIRHDFSAPHATVHLAYSAEDRCEQNPHALGLSGGSGTIGNAALFLPMLHNVESVYFDTAYTGNADVVFTTGRSASGDYRQAKHVVLLGDNPFADRYHKVRDLAGPARLLYPDLKTAVLEKPATFQLAWPWDKPRPLTAERVEAAIEVPSLPAGAQALGLSADGKYALGFLDDRHLVIPNGRLLQARSGDMQWLYRAYLAAAKRWKIDIADNTADSSQYRSDTRELTIDWGFGTMIINTPRTQGFSGLPGWRSDNTTANLNVKLTGPYGNVLLTSADSKPIADSHRLLLVAAGRMQNTGAAIGKNKAGFLDVITIGKAPVLVEALRGQVSITSNAADSLLVYALDCEGNRRGKVETTRTGKCLTFVLSPRWTTIWFELATADIVAPEKLAATWPAEEKPRSSPPEAPELVSVKELLNPPVAPTPTAATKPASNEKTIHVVAKDFAVDNACHSYGNIKTKVQTEGDKTVVRAQFGKVDQSWHGGLWFMITPPTGVKAADVQGFGFAFKGDGTAPREAHLLLKSAAGVPYTSVNLHKIFESDAWQEVVLTAEDFGIEPGYLKKNPDLKAPAHPDLTTVTRLDFGCTGPLMDQMSVGTFGNSFFILPRSAENEVMSATTLHSKLPAAVPPAAGTVTVPFLGDAQITADGLPNEAEWKKSRAIAMDEEHVPSWHFFGSHIVEGKRHNGEGANFWLLATKSGLAILAEIHKGTPDILAQRPNWYECDCLEIFSDVANKGEKPTKQLFLAYQRPNLDRAAASDPSIQIGRTKLDDGYVLETLIPWAALGFTDVPAGAFGIEFQLDIAQKDLGRLLQMTYGTGINEAWISAKHFLKVKLAN
ncbi:MAG: sugar-binding protein, partial [Phycisphaerae bacterium]